MSASINYTHFGSKFDSKLSPEVDIVYGVVLLTIGVVASVGNTGCIAMFSSRYTTLTSAEVLLLNLSWVNLSLAVISYPAAMAAFFLHQWVLGDIGCTVYGFICYLLGIVNITSLATLAFVRYVKTCDRRRGHLITSRGVKIAVVCSYVFATIWASFPLLGVGSYDVEPFGLSCTLDWANPEAGGHAYIIISVLLVIGVPTLLIILCYAKILLLVHRNHRRRKVSLKKTKRKDSVLPTELRLTMVSLVICMSFIMAWFPYAVVSIYYGVIGAQTPPVYVSLIPVMLAKSSCAYNPIFYVLVNSRYREEFYHVWGSLSECVAQVFSRHGRVEVSARGEKKVRNEEIPSDRDMETKGTADLEREICLQMLEKAPLDKAVRDVSTNDAQIHSTERSPQSEENINVNEIEENKQSIEIKQFDQTPSRLTTHEPTYENRFRAEIQTLQHKTDYMVIQLPYKNDTNE